MKTIMYSKRGVSLRLLGGGKRGVSLRLLGGGLRSS